MMHDRLSVVPASDKDGNMMKAVSDIATIAMIVYEYERSLLYGGIEHHDVDEVRRNLHKWNCRLELLINSRV